MERSFLGIGAREFIILIFLLLSGLLPLALMYFMTGVSNVEPPKKYYQQPEEHHRIDNTDVQEFAEQTLKLNLSTDFM